MDADGRKHNKGKRILLAPFIGLNKALLKMLSSALGESYLGDVVTQDDIISMVDARNESGTAETSSAKLLNNIFEFGDLVASDVMTHRTNIVAVDINSSLDDIVYLALDKGFSRIPVYKETIDEIVGIVIVKDLLCLIGDGDAKNLKIGDFLREVFYLPESCSCSDVFKYLTTLKSGMGVVVDEYGGTAGIITLEDIIESIMGDIEDEYDDEVDMIKKISDNTFEVDGEADPEEVLELFGYELEDDHEYDTIAGFVTDLLGYIPEDVNSMLAVEYKEITFTVLSVEDNCINKLMVNSTEALQQNK